MPLAVGGLPFGFNMGFRLNKVRSDGYVGGFRVASGVVKLAGIS